jgi:hypothetical protein
MKSNLCKTGFQGRINPAGNSIRPIRPAEISENPDMVVRSEQETTSAKSAAADPVAFRLVILESPFAGDVEANVEYARLCLRDCLLRGEAPLASHLLYTQPGVLDDDLPAERRLGIGAGLAWGGAAAATVVYTDRGVSAGMEAGIARARAEGRRVEYRALRAAG